MSKTIVAVSALIAAASPASAGPTTTFERDGETYVYRTEVRNDHAIITGRRFPSGSAFRLVVRGDRVRGVSGGVPVEFTRRDALASVTDQALASR